MGLRCKAGDMAVLIKSARPDIVDVGSIVEVIRLAIPEGFSDEWIISHRGRGIFYGCTISAPDSWLLPIRPDELKEETEQEVTA